MKAVTHGGFYFACSGRYLFKDVEYPKMTSWLTVLPGWYFTCFVKHAGHPIDGKTSQGESCQLVPV